MLNRKLGLFLVVFLMPIAVFGQNLLINPTYDANLDGWMPSGTADLISSWSGVDADLSPCSGAADTVNDSTKTFGLRNLEQCVENVIAGELYDFGASNRIPAGQERNVRGFITVFWHDEPGCPSFNIGTEASQEVVSGDTEGVWVDSFFSGGPAPVGAQSATFSLVSGKSNSTIKNAQVQFDNAFFRRSNAPLAPAVSITPEEIADSSQQTIQISVVFPSGVASITDVFASYDGADVTALLSPFVTSLTDNAAQVLIPGLSFAPGTTALLLMRVTTTQGRDRDTLCINVAK